jgi:hypothetical protein
MGIFRDKERGRLRTVWRFLVFLAGVPAIMVSVGWVLYPIVDASGLIPKGVPVAVVPYALTFILTLAWVVLCRRLLDRRSVSSLGLSVSGTGVLWAAAAGLLGGLLAGGSLGILWVAGAYRHVGDAEAMLSARVAFVFPFAAFLEEIMCRGYLLQNLREVRRPVVGIVFSSLVFSALHALNPAIFSFVVPAVNLLLVGVLFALAYIVSGNIWFPTALHLGWNLAEGPLLGTPVSGLTMDGWVDLKAVSGASDLLTGGEFGLEGSIVTTGVLCVAIIGFLLVLRRHAAHSDGRG